MSTTKAVSTDEEQEIILFFSYSHQDEMLRDQLEQHFGFLKRDQSITCWHDRKIMPGDDWCGEIDEQLDQADIILLLISPGFADSDYCWDVETKRALERHEKGEATVVPIILRPVDGWENTPIGRLQALPSNGDAVTTWPNHDEAFQDIAAGLRSLITHRIRNKTYATPAWVEWSLKLEGGIEGYPDKRIHMLTAQLRKAANSEKLEYLEMLEGSVVLKYRSTPAVRDALKSLHEQSKLQNLINYPILSFETDLGAVLRIESRIVNDEYHSTIHYLPEIFGGRTLEESFPPLVGGSTFPIYNPMQMGFNLFTDETAPPLSPSDQQGLQARLGRYLNTFLVLKGDQINVTLNPTDEFCGLPPLLRHTELGRDMLAQDVVLKHYTSAQLHPSTPLGKAFWQQAEAITDSTEDFEACFRVWIVPDDASVHEKSENDQGHVTIEKLGLKVLCEADYNTLQTLQYQRSSTPHSVIRQDGTEQLVDLFRQLIVPEIQKEVSSGSRFGLLRQILSVFVIAKWVMGSQLGGALKQTGFMASNNPEKYGLCTVDEKVILSMKQVYLQLFGEGVWQHTTTRFNMESNSVRRQLHIVGGVEF
jgi:hypothetical protein